MATELEKTIADIVRANAQLEQAAARAEASLLVAFRRAEARAFERISSLLASAPNFSTTELTNRLAWYFQNIPSLEIAAAQSAYGTAIESYLDKYPRLGRLAEGIIQAGGIPKDLTAIPQEVINALRTRDINHFNFLNSGALARLDQQLLDSVVIGRTPAGTLSQLRGVITGSYSWGQTRGLYEWHAGTYARTANMRFSRQIIGTKADELKLRWFIYVGPVDSKKRPFCLEIVGGSFEREDIEDLDNGQTGDTFSDGGGFNCRDTWSPVGKDVFDDLRAEDGGGAPMVNETISRQHRGASPGRTSPRTKTPEPGRARLPARNPQGFSAAKTIAEAERFAIQNELARLVNYKTLDLEVANILNQRMLAHVQAYPALKNALDYLGGSRGWVSEMRKRMIAQFQKEGHSASIAKKLAERVIKSPRSAVQDFQTSGPQTVRRELVIKGRSIVINDRYGGKRAIRRSARGDEEVGVDMWGRTIKRLNDQNYLAGETITDAINHEIGHLVDDLLAGLENPETWSQTVGKFRQLLTEEITARGTTVSGLISDYGSTKIQEAFAETWAAIQTGEPSAGIKVLADVILQRLADKGAL